MFDVLILRMAPREPIPGTVNLIGRWFYSTDKNRNMATIGHLLSVLRLRIHTVFLDLTTLSETGDFHLGEYDIFICNTRFNRRIVERFSERTSRRALVDTLGVSLVCIDEESLLSGGENNPLLMAGDLSSMGFAEDYNRAVRMLRSADIVGEEDSNIVNILGYGI